MPKESYKKSRLWLFCGFVHRVWVRYSAFGPGSSMVKTNIKHSEAVGSVPLFQINRLMVEWGSEEHLKPTLNAETEVGPVLLNLCRISSRIRVLKSLWNNGTMVFCSQDDHRSEERKLPLTASLVLLWKNIAWDPSLILNTILHIRDDFWNWVRPFAKCSCLHVSLTLVAIFHHEM